MFDCLGYCCSVLCCCVPILCSVLPCHDDYDKMMTVMMTAMIFCGNISSNWDRDTSLNLLDWMMRKSTHTSHDHFAYPAMFRETKRECGQTMKTGADMDTNYWKSSSTSTKIIGRSPNWTSPVSPSWISSHILSAANKIQNGGRFLCIAPNWTNFPWKFHLICGLQISRFCSNLSNRFLWPMIYLFFGRNRRINTQTTFMS